MSEINIDSSYGVVIIQDLELVYVDENYARIFGYESARHLLENIQSFLDLIAPEYHEIALDNYYSIISGKKIPHGQTATNLDQNGRPLTVFTIDHLIEWHGKPALQVTVLDMSLIAEANRRLQESHLKYKRLVTQSAQGIMVHRDFKPLLVNQAWVDMMHAPSKEYVIEQVNILDLFEPDARNAVIEKYKKMMSSRSKGFSSVVENRCFDGEIRFFNVYDNVIDWDDEPAMQVVIEDVTEKVLLERELAFRAHHDSLTQLLNREAIYQWLEERLQHCHTLSCLLIDVDDFKQTNDSFGHFGGDAVIKGIADICQQVVGSDGAVGRWGGEEFIIFLDDVSFEHTMQLARQLRELVANTPMQFQTRWITQTVSIGVSFADASELVCIDDMISEADRNLYVAKAEGKNRVQDSQVQD